MPSTQNSLLYLSQQANHITCHPENVILMQEYLESLPLLLDFAAQGLEGLEKRRKNDYHLIFMDIQMPVMDVHQATRPIRQWEQGQAVDRVPIVALTAPALSGTAAATTDAGC